MKKNRFNFSPLSITLLSITLILAFLGLFFIFEASTAESYKLFGHQYHFLQRQTISSILGIIALVVAWSIPPKFWESMAGPIFASSLFLLVLVLIPGVGISLNGAKRWFSIGGIVFQPVEIFKFSAVLFYANWLQKFPKPKTFIFFTAIFSILLLLQPDMGSLLILLWIVFGLFFLAGGRMIVLGGLSVVGFLLIGLAIFTSPYRLQRLTTYINPELDPLGSGFHVRQITLALGNGGWFGSGIGNSQQKYAYIPEVSSDSIFAIVAEELGFMGSIIIILLMMSYITLIFMIGQKQKEKSFEQLLVYGIGLWMSGQMLLNLAAVVALVPLTGLPLPFFSYGGTSLIMTLFATGIVLAVNRTGEQ